MSNNVPTVGDVPPESVPSKSDQAPVAEGSLLAAPGQNDEELSKEKSLNKWHDFESQYSLAMEQSVVIEREAWGSQLEFLMSCIASAVGLGNIWRFPFICGQNGGGAFLIPYIVVLTIIGRPLYMLELGLGQFVSGGPIKIWEMAPGFRGVGYTATVASFFLASFYMVIMGWSILYVIYSFFPNLPWTQKTFYTPDLGKINVNNDTDPFFGLGHLGEPDISEKIVISGKNKTKNQFFLGKGLDGPPVLTCTMGLLLGWIIVWASMVAGVEGSGKIAYFTALFPYVVLFILLVAGATLKGADIGIVYLFKPDFYKILTPKAWFEAVGQCFFSLGITFGGCIMFASFNKFHHKLGRDIIIISIMDTFTSLLAGSCLFMLLGYLDHKNLQLFKAGQIKTRTSVANLSEKSGAGMAFVVFPQVLNAFGNYPGPQIFSFLFFFMIMTLAVGSANGIVGTIVTVICDAFPKWKRPIVLTILCLVCFLLGLVYTCRTGNNVIDIVDKYGTEQVVYMMAIFETAGVAYVYGLKNICNDFEFMMGYHLSWYWIISWAFLPILLITIFISYLVTWENTKGHPKIAVACGWALTGLVWSIFPCIMGVIIYTRKSRSYVKRIKASFLPTRNWGPKDPAVREAWRRWKKTRPSEFDLTVKVLKFLRLRSDIAPPDTQQYWTQPNNSQYQAESESKLPSTTVIVASSTPSTAATLETGSEAALK